MKQKLKKLVSLLLVGGMLMSTVGCGGNASGSKESKKRDENVSSESEDGTKGEVTVWTKDDSIGVYDDFLKEKYPDLKVNLVVMDDDTIRTKLKAVMNAGATPPDVVLVEIGMWKEMMNLPIWQDLSEEPFVAEDVLTEHYDYIQELSKNEEGKIVGLSNQATPAAYYYRRSIAKEALGTDDPDEIASRLTDWDSVMATGKEVYNKAGVSLFPCIDDIIRIQSNISPEPWIRDGQFVIDENVTKALELAKQADEAHVAGRLEMWGPEWRDNLNTANSSMGLFIATWLMAYDIPSAAPDTKGDWGFAQIIEPQFYGGSFFAMPEGAENKAQAWEYIKTVTGDHDFLNFFSNEVGDFCSNKVVNEELAKTNEENPWWGGQNSIQAFNDVAANADARAMYDFQSDAIGAVTEAAREYVYNGKTMDEAIQILKDVVTANISSVEIVEK